MSIYRKKPIEVEAITFDELIAYAKNKYIAGFGGNIVDGIPWSFEYKGHQISHETDTCYLIPTPEGIMNFTPADMLITGVNGEIYPCKIAIFNKTYEFVSDKEYGLYDL